MAADTSIDVEDTQILPYLACAPPAEVIEWLKDDVPPGYLDFDRDLIGTFDPFAEARRAQTATQPVTDEEVAEAVDTAHLAASAFALAVQIAAVVCNYWTLTDRWEWYHEEPDYVKGNFNVNVVHKFPAPRPPVSSASAPPMNIGNPAKKARLAESLATMSDGEYKVDRVPADGAKKLDLNALSGTGPVFKEIVGMSNSMTEEQVRRMALETLGVRDHANGSGSSPKMQVRFQGMWWGTERIWEGDFVRIKMGRAAFAPHGAPNVYAPSGPGKRRMQLIINSLKAQEERELGLGLSASPMQVDKGKGREVDSAYLSEALKGQGAETRGVFMKIDSIFVVEAKRGETLKKEARIAGMLYELADADWEETEPDLRPQYEAEMAQRAAILRQRNGKQPAFQAAVNESLLPSTPAPIQQSMPPTGQFLFPQAPVGYRFRPILKEGYNAILTVALMSGRYYPRLLSHPLLADALRRAAEIGRREGVLRESNNLFSLENLCPGHFNAMDPEFYKKTGRLAMVEEADRHAVVELKRNEEERLIKWNRMTNQEEDDDQLGMTVDELQLLEGTAMNID